MSETLLEAKRLYRLGFAIIWLHPKSKRPVESGWTTGPRTPWLVLKETYNEGYNVGVRLGTPSKIGDTGFLTVVDVDVKSDNPRHRDEAIAAAESLVRGQSCPRVESGRGNGSRHYYCLTVEPFKTFNPAASEEKVKVFMPSKKPSKKEIETLTGNEIAEGIRIANAWEISLYSDGRQVVLPPSIHPDSGKPYVWSSNVMVVEDLPVIEFDKPAEGDAPKQKDGTLVEDNITVEDFEVELVDLAWLPISDKIRDGIIHGKDVSDRSGYLLPACAALLGAGLSKNEVLTVLTDPATFLGACAYDHAKTTSRKRAAQWVWKYTLKRVMEERDATLAFAGKAIVESRKLTPSEAAQQAEDFEAERHWTDYLERTEKGGRKNTLNNCKLILMNVCPQKAVVGRNEFAANDYYLCDTPWKSKKGEAVSDIDIVRIKTYCAAKQGIEFGDNTINQALMSIADDNRFHPVKTWLEGLKWDGVPRIDTWLKDYAGAEAPDLYLAEVSRKVLCAMVARVFEPGCKFDYVLILEGLQGTGKSTFLRHLADPWFSDATLNIGDKDAVLTMQSKWLIELGELSSMKRTEVEQMKAFITQTTDRIRAPYGKRVEEFPRQCIFIGSTNNDEYLPDLTGNRRFWPVRVNTISFGALSKVREQLFAEAVAYYRLGEPLYLEDSATHEQAASEQQKRSTSDEWIGTVGDILGGELFPRSHFEIKDVAKRMDQLGAHKMSPHDTQRITRCLKLLGCEAWRETGGNRRRLWKTAEFIKSTVLTQAQEDYRIHGPKSKFGPAARKRIEASNGGPTPSTKTEVENNDVISDFY